MNPVQELAGSASVARCFLRHLTAHETAMTERIYGRNEVKEVLARSRSAINQLVVRLQSEFQISRVIGFVTCLGSTTVFGLVFIG
jgi:hypothetical protein